MRETEQSPAQRPRPHSVTEGRVHGRLPRYQGTLVPVKTRTLKLSRLGLHSPVREGRNLRERELGVNPAPLSTLWMLLQSAFFVNPYFSRGRLGFFRDTLHRVPPRERETRYPYRFVAGVKRSPRLEQSRAGGQFQGP